MPRHKREIIIVVVPMSAIREFIAVDLIGSTAFYYTLKLTLRKLIFADAVAIAGSIVLPIVYKQVVRRASAVLRDNRNKSPHTNKASGAMA